MSKDNKEGYVFPMVIWPEFRMWQYRDDNHQEDAPHFIMQASILVLRIKFWTHIKQDDVVKLYDLSSLCEKKKPSPNQKSDENPYLHSVASLLLKLVSNLEKEELSGNLTEAESRENRNNITRLLNQGNVLSKTTFILEGWKITL